MTELKADKQVKTVVYLGLGANIGRNPAETILEAFDILSKKLLDAPVISSIYLTAPQDIINQPFFHNAVCSGLWNGSPLSLLESIHEIEESLGRCREKEQRRGPRPIDIDILLFGDFSINYGRETDGKGCWLKIPHERLNNRRFALVPLIELSPELRDPLSGQKFSSIEASICDQEITIL